MALKFCSLASGSSGNCQWIGSEKTALFLDAGLSGKYIGAAMASISEDIQRVRGVLITHEHVDHIKGVGVLLRRYGIDLYANEKTFEAVESKLGKYQDSQIKLFKNNEAFEVGDLIVKPFSISHDAVDPVAYSFLEGRSKISVATDLGTVTDAILKEIIDSDLLMLEANHDVEMLKVGPYPYYLKQRILSEIGHLSNDHAGEVSLEAVNHGKLKHILLGHISKENNHPELAYETVRACLEEGGIEIGTDVQLDMTYRDRVSRLYQLK